MSSDAGAAHLKALEEYEKFYKNSLVKGDGYTAINHAEMAQVLEDVIGLFKSFGVGVRKNIIGQNLPAKKSWERHG